jgi:hypothetical protein
MFGSRVSTWFNSNQRRGSSSGTNSSLVFTVGGANIYQSNAQVQFGNTSVFSGGTGYVRTTTATAAANVALNDFTIEGWCYFPAARTSAQNAIPVISQTSGALGVRFGNNGGSDTNLNQIQIFRRAGVDGEYSNITWPRDQWNHWVVQRTGGGTANAQISFWVNGTKLTTLAGRTGNVANVSFTNSTGLDYCSAGGVEGLRNGYLDEICITNGNARYNTVGNIVVPIEPNIVDTQTGLLMHFNAANGSTTFNNATT